MRQRTALRFLALLVTASGGVSFAAAQQAPPPAREPGAIKVRVELVTVPLVARNARGDYVYDLTRADLAVLDNGVPQSLTLFETAQQPVALVLLFDTSQRVAPLLERVRKSGEVFAAHVVGGSGQAAVVTFDSEVRLRQDFTSDPEKIVQAVAKIAAGGGKTRLADALAQAVRLLAERPAGERRVIVAISEAIDDGSGTALGAGLRLAQLNDISVYTISLSYLEAETRRGPDERPAPASPFPPGVEIGPRIPGAVQTPSTESTQRYSRVDLLAAVRELVRTLRNTLGRNVLEVYAEGTGGLHLGQISQRGIEEAIAAIGADLRSQYLLGYQPSNRDEPGYHNIEVRISRPGVSLRTRPGYFVGAAP